MEQQAAQDLAARKGRRVPHPMHVRSVVEDLVVLADLVAPGGAEGVGKIGFIDQRVTSLIALWPRICVENKAFVFRVLLHQPSKQVAVNSPR